MPYIKCMLDIAAFNTFVTFRMMRNDIFTENDLWRRHDFSLGKITPAPQTTTCTANHLVQVLVSNVPQTTVHGQVF